MKKIIISPYSRVLRNGKENPKNYPYWNEVISGLKLHEIYICQIGTALEKRLDNVDEFLTNRPLKELRQMLNEYDTWISVDNFFQHFCWLHNKPGIVIFGLSDPLIFGHSENTNLLKDRSYLRKRIAQFQTWEEIEYGKECFVEPVVIIDKILGEFECQI